MTKKELEKALEDEKHANVELHSKVMRLNHLEKELEWERENLSRILTALIHANNSISKSKKL